MKRLIVNADDLGVTRGVNRAIARGHSKGIVTSATLMANGSAFDDAVRLARENPRLSIGCHVVLLDGSPLSPKEKVKSLLHRETEFYATIGQFAPRALLGRFNHQEIAIEAQAQFRRLQSAGVDISHFDAHKHAHMFPAVLSAVLKAAKEAGIPAVRNPFEPSGVLPIATVRGSKKLAIRTVEVAILRALHGSFLKAVKNAGLLTPDGSIGIAATGTLNLELLGQMIEHLPDGTWELVCHPGYNDSELAGVRTSLRTSREVELDLLTSADARDILARNGVELISYREFVSHT